MNVKAITILAFACSGMFGGASRPAHGDATAAEDPGAIRVRSFQPEKPLSRARRPTRITAVVENTGKRDVVVGPALVCPPGVRALHLPDARVTLRAGRGATTTTLKWDIEADTEMRAKLWLGLKSGNNVSTSATLSMLFLPPVEMRKAPYVPESVPVKTDVLVGALNCPLWEPNDPTWNFLPKHPERTPALGVYDQSNPEVADWETKWAVEHGISFFVYCWYRASKGDAVETKYSSAIDALLKSRYVDKFKFAIMWENQPRDAAKWGRSGVTDEKDLIGNLMPFWMANYFKHPSYLTVDNKPLLFIYDAHQLAHQLGGPRNVPKAFERMRQACKREGFAGLYLLGEYRGLEPKELQFRKDMGFDYVFPYVWPVGEPWRPVEMQVDYMRKAQETRIIPWVLTASQGWSGWNDQPARYLYTLSPRDYEGLLRKAKEFIATRPHNELGSRMLLLDDWNEWGEGHYIAPHRQYGFGYLDAVRKVFSNAPERHVDLLPEDIGLGPYDSAYKTHKK